MRTFVFALLTFIPFPLYAQAPATEIKTDGQRVFVCAHSFHIFVNKYIGPMAKSAGIENHKDAGRQMIGGSRVTQHWDLADEKNICKKTIKTGEVDVLTLSPHLKMPDEGVDKFVDLMLENNPKGKIYVQASWYPFDLPGKGILNFGNEDRNKIKVEEIRKASEPTYKAFVEQIQTLNKKYEDKQKRQVVFMVPAGPAVYALREQVEAGKVPGLAKPSEMFKDGIGHASLPVELLVTYCNFACIYKKNPVGLPMPEVLTKAKNPAWDDKFNKLLQEIAWEAACAEKLSGVYKDSSK